MAGQWEAPAIVRVAVANVDFVRGGDGKYIAQLCQWADLLLLQEAKNITVANLLPAGWVSLQDTSDPARKGSCIAYNAAVIERRWDRLHLGAKPFIFGRRIGMLPRYYQAATFRHIKSGRRFVAVSAHLPPFRFRLLQPGYMRRLRKSVNRFPNAIVGADANMHLGKFAFKLGLEPYGKGIVGLATRLSVVRPRIRPWGVKRGLTDHPAVTASVFIRQK